MERIDIGQNVNLFRFRDTLDARIRRMFRVNGITTVRDLCLQNKRDLLKTREVGIRSIRLIETILESYGLWLGMHETELDEYARAAQKEGKSRPLLPLRKKRKRRSGNNAGTKSPKRCSYSTVCWPSPPSKRQTT